jgi:hypothetical protein
MKLISCCGVQPRKALWTRVHNQCVAPLLTLSNGDMQGGMGFAWQIIEILLKFNNGEPIFLELKLFLL